MSNLGFLSEVDAQPFFIFFPKFRPPQFFQGFVWFEFQIILKNVMFYFKKIMIFGSNFELKIYHPKKEYSFKVLRLEANDYSEYYLLDFLLR